MATLIILSLITVVGLFFLYQVMVWDDHAGGPSFHIRLIRFDKMFPPKGSVKPKAQIKPAKPLFSFLKFKSIQRTVKVEPVTDLKDFDPPPVKPLLQPAASVSMAPRPEIFKPIEQKITPPAPAAKPVELSVDDLKKRLNDLQQAHDRLERTLQERTVKLDQIQRGLDAEVKSRMEWEFSKSSLDKKIVSLEEKLIERDRVIQTLRSRQPAPDGRMEPETVSPDAAKDFATLPPDVIHGAPGSPGVFAFQEGAVRPVFYDASNDVLYRMPTEEEVITHLKSRRKPDVKA